MKYYREYRIKLLTINSKPLQLEGTLLREVGDNTTPLQDYIQMDKSYNKRMK